MNNILIIGADSMWVAFGCCWLVRSADMLEGLPDEKVVITFVAHLCVRLLASSKEVHVRY